MREAQIPTGVSVDCTVVVNLLEALEQIHGVWLRSWMKPRRGQFGIGRIQPGVHEWTRVLAIGIRTCRKDDGWTWACCVSEN